MKTIQINNLKKYYGHHMGVEDVTFDVRKGEILGFIGPNGAGKSTVIRVLMNLIFKSDGEVTILDQALSSKLNKNLGYLPSEVFLYEELTVLKQLKYFAKIRGCKDDKIYELAEILDLDLKRKIRELSFGNKKKVGIIAALMHEPSLIILDEPTPGLDPLIQQRFFKLLETEKKRGATILLSSHILSEIEKVCDRIALIKEGKILFIDMIENLALKQFKKITINPYDENIKLEGLTMLNQENGQGIYHYRGDINNLIKYLTNFKLKSLNINDLDLEEIFMHYYQKD